VSDAELDALAQSTAEELRHCVDQFEDGWGFNIAMAKDCLFRVFRTCSGDPPPSGKKETQL
jgi:hypothetical protein